MVQGGVGGHIPHSASMTHHDVDVSLCCPDCIELRGMLIYVAMSGGQNCVNLALGFGLGAVIGFGS